MLIQKSRSSSAVLPEAEIALCCARTWPDPQARARMAMLLEQPVDWPRLLRIAVRSGVMPLVASHPCPPLAHHPTAAQEQRAIVMPTLTFVPSKRPLRIHRRRRPVRVGRPLPQRRWR